MGDTQEEQKTEEQKTAEKQEEPNTAEKQEERKPETDWKAHAREWEKRAKENAEAAKKLQEIEDANKSETERLAGQLSTLQEELKEARLEGVRKAAIASGVDPELAEFINAADVETAQAQADKLVAALAAKRKEEPKTPGTPGYQGNKGSQDTGSLSTGAELYAAKKNKK